MLITMLANFQKFNRKCQAEGEEPTPVYTKWCPDSPERFLFKSSFLKSLLPPAESSGLLISLAPSTNVQS